MADSISRQALAAELTLSEAIQYLPPELREIIYKEYLAIEKRQQEALSRRELMGWGEVYYALLWAPFCEERERIVKVVSCRKCNTCGLDGLCYVCFKNGAKHYISSYNNTPSDPKSLYSPVQNPCHISIIFCTCHHPCLFQSFLNFKKKTTPTITEIYSKNDLHNF